ncbi:MAG: hypothetical protein UX17_C0073G0004 [Parcubacteria group bacterium GW2011_GWC2_45_7]|nr:MAG: hypothetical protein UX17_C0073G0004 [Parcubacteria group bacterium GW2011_GWC2_45_7]
MLVFIWLFVYARIAKKLRCGQIRYFCGLNAYLSTVLNTKIDQYDL